MDDALALRALAAVISDSVLRDRFMALTGYDSTTLRARAGERDVLQAVIAFLGQNETDLLRISGQLDVKPALLMAAG